MNKMKYIVYQDHWMLPTPIIFPDSIKHDQMALDVIGPKWSERVLGAGFIMLTSNGLECYGDSFSLKVKSREEDTALINKFLGED